MMAVPILFVSHLAAAELLECIRTRKWSPEWKSQGLADYFADVRNPDAFAFNDVAAGPEGLPGCIACVWPEAADPPDGVGYFPADQDWQRAAEGVWVTCAGTPRPEDIERHYIAARSTELVQFADGGVWDVPVLREPQGREEQMVFAELHAAGLPESIRKDPATGEWRATVLPEYAELFEESRTWFNFFLTSEQMEVRWSDVFDYVVRVMSLRYRYGHLLHSVFGHDWITTENIWHVARVSCGYELLMRHSAEKKKRMTA